MSFKKLLLLTLFLLINSSLIFAQSSISGIVTDENNAPILNATVGLIGTKYATYTNNKGFFEIENIPNGAYTLELRLIGYLPKKEKVNLDGDALKLNVSLIPDVLGLNQVVVSGNRLLNPRQEAPVIVNLVKRELINSVQALTLAEGLNYGTGLRVENNCSNCGFTSVRLNGLQGPYTQILINSRPVFSALSSVYGLEQIPATMLEQIEVVRGGGSVLYGGNAIAGTINIITREPKGNSFEVSSQISSIGGRATDAQISASGSIGDSLGKKGISFYVLNRNRNPLDINKDGFTDITKLQNTTIGGNGYYYTKSGNRLGFSFNTLQEFRRGGNRLDLEPHQADITEQIRTNLSGVGLTYDINNLGRNQTLGLYYSMQANQRESYYGGGGRVLQPGDSLTESDVLAINAYGRSNDFSFIGGAQYNKTNILNFLTFTAGFEVKGSIATDAMPGYGRSINQSVYTPGVFSQLQAQVNKRLSFTAGLRFDQVLVDGVYRYTDTTLDNGLQQYPVFIPRFTAFYKITDDWKLRASFAQGYRAPQAFDEDLHIETVGGAARFINLSPTLRTERSNSVNVSSDYTVVLGEKGIFNFILEGFYTRLDNPFINANPVELENGISVLTKRNGEGAFVQGINFEVNYTNNKGFTLQSGYTLQQALYDSPELLWEPEVSIGDAGVFTTQILRTPQSYGFANAVYSLANWKFTVNGLLTGPMVIPHTVDPDLERVELKRSPTFFEMGTKISREFAFKNKTKIELSAGVYNLFNAFQQDLDRGALRDANYIYGPLRPRTVYLGLRWFM